MVGDGRQALMSLPSLPGTNTSSATFLALAVLAVPIGGLAVWTARAAAATAPRMAGNLTISASVIGFLPIVVAYMRIAPFETKVVFGVAALALALLFVLLTDLFPRARAHSESPRPGSTKSR